MRERHGTASSADDALPENPLAGSSVSPAIVAGAVHVPPTRRAWRVTPDELVDTSSISPPPMPEEMASDDASPAASTTAAAANGPLATGWRRAYTFPSAASMYARTMAPPQARTAAYGFDVDVVASRMPSRAQIPFVRRIR